MEHDPDFTAVPVVLGGRRKPALQHQGFLAPMLSQANRADPMSQAPGQIKV